MAGARPGAHGSCNKITSPIYIYMIIYYVIICMYIYIYIYYIYIYYAVNLIIRNKKTHCTHVLPFQVGQPWSAKWLLKDSIISIPPCCPGRIRSCHSPSWWTSPRRWGDTPRCQGPVGLQKNRSIARFFLRLGRILDMDEYGCFWIFMIIFACSWQN